MKQKNQNIFLIERETDRQKSSEICFMETMAKKLS